MKITNTLAPLYERWDDPGDYPSGAAGYALPSRTYVVGASGTYVVDLNAQRQFAEPSPEIDDVVDDALASLSPNLIPLVTRIEVTHELIQGPTRLRSRVSHISVAFDELHDDGYEPDEPSYAKEGE